MGVRGHDVVVLGVEKKSVAKLQEERTVRKICLLDDHVVMAFAGISNNYFQLFRNILYECFLFKYLFLCFLVLRSHR